MNDHLPLDLDAVTAHMDRGWDLLARGDLKGARISVDQVLDLDGESPEAACLAGAIAAARGQDAEAMEAFQEAMDMAPEYAEPVIQAANLCIHGMNDLEQGLQHCRDAEAMNLDAGDAAEVKLLMAEANAVMGQDGDAQRMIDGLGPPPFLDPSHHVRAGRLLLELGKLERAEELLDGGLAYSETRAESHYFLGVALDRSGDVVSARRHLARSLELERERPPAYAPLGDEDLGDLINQALELLSPVARRQLGGAPLSVLDHPPLELVAEGFDPRCPAFTSGAGGQGRGGRTTLVTHIFIYRRNVERVGPHWDVMVAALHLALEQEFEDLLTAGR